MKSALDDQHAIVTGASRGIGAATAERLAALGANVTLVARTASTLERRCGELREQYGGQYVAAPADVTDRDAVGHAFEEARNALGPVDILVNNVGGAESARFANLDAETWHRMIELNLDTVYYCTREVLPEMLEAGDGRVVNNASTSGLTGYKYVSAYSAAKHGVVGLTKSVAKEVAGSGVTVNAVCPGYTDTAMVDEGAHEAAVGADKSPEEIKESFKRLNPQDRFVQPEEVASTIAWLCRPEQRSINGEAIAIDGGETA
jgi:NAD(P)-dependent dehydrogenase (short-subunit alcohol dehydrogenase family)